MPYRGRACLTVSPSLSFRLYFEGMILSAHESDIVAGPPTSPPESVAGGGPTRWAVVLGQLRTLQARTARMAAPLPPVLLGMAMGYYVLHFSMFTLRDHAGFGTYSFDLGIFQQGLWLLSRFESPFVTLLGLQLFGDHTSFILLPFVPVYWIWPSPGVLLVAQSVALGLGALPVFLLARKLLASEWVALLLAAAYLLNPAIAWINLEDFHPDAFEVPLILFAVFFAVSRRWRAFIAVVVLLLLVKEDTGLVAVPLGLWVAARYNRKVGLVTAGASALWLVLAIWVIGPAFSGTAAGSLDDWRIPFGGVGSLARKAVTAPWEVGGYVLTAEKLKYVIQLLTPTAFLSLLSSFSLVALPALLFNLLSTFGYQYWLEYHYTSPLVPIATAATIFGLTRFRRSHLRLALAALVLIGALHAASQWGPYDWSDKVAFQADADSPEAQAARKALALIPADAVVSSRSNYSPHLANRREVYDFPNPWVANYWGDDSLKGQRLPQADEVEYVIEYPAHLTPPADGAYARLPSEGFRLIFEEAGVELWQRETSGFPTEGTD